MLCYELTNYDIIWLTKSIMPSGYCRVLILMAQSEICSLLFVLTVFMLFVLCDYACMAGCVYVCLVKLGILN